LLAWAVLTWEKVSDRSVLKAGETLDQTGDRRCSGCRAHQGVVGGLGLRHTPTSFSQRHPDRGWIADREVVDG